MSLESVPLENKVNFIRRILEAGGSLIGLALPTLALIKLEGLPDDISRIAHVLLPAVSLALVVVIFIRGADIGRLSSKRASMATLVLALSGALLTFTYSWTSDKLVVSLIDVENGKDVLSEVHIRPVWPSKTLQTMMGKYGDDYETALYDSPNAADIKARMFRERGFSVALLLMSLLLAQLLFVASIVGGAWWLAERNVPSGPPN
jgi:hypothetical protein